MFAGPARAAARQACVLMALIGVAAATTDASFKFSVIHLNDNREGLQVVFPTAVLHCRRASCALQTTILALTSREPALSCL